MMTRTTSVSFRAARRSPLPTRRPHPPRTSSLPRRKASQRSKTAPGRKWRTKNVPLLTSCKARSRRIKSPPNDSSLMSPWRTVVPDHRRRRQFPTSRWRLRKSMNRLPRCKCRPLIKKWRHPRIRRKKFKKSRSLSRRMLPPKLKFKQSQTTTRWRMPEQ